MKFVLSTLWTFVRFIKLESPTVKERYAPIWGKTQQPIGARQHKTGILSGSASKSCWRITSNFPLCFPVLTYLYADGGLRLNRCIAKVLLSHSPLPWLFWYSTESAAHFWKNPSGDWLFIGRTHSHICIWREREQNKRIQSILEIFFFFQVISAQDKIEKEARIK